MLNSFSFENYRSFSRRQNIELRPLTLLFGWNSGGKSATLRFIPLISESIQVGGPPIWLGGSVGRRATWSSLVCRATGRSALGFSLGWDDHINYDWKIAGNPEGTYQEIESLEINKIPQDLNTYNWKGILPCGIEGAHLSNSIQILKSNLLSLRNEVQWISGVRTRPNRIVTYGGGAAGTLNPDGSDAVDHLIAAQLQSSASPLLEATRSFFSEMGEQLILDNPFDGAWRALLYPKGGPQVRVDLCDTGEGYSQVLPVLVALARAKNGGPRLLFLEQPELHLHTKAQVALANQLVNTAQSSTSPRILVETHSEVLLTSIQLAIAREELKSDQVIIYWIEARPDGTSDAIPVTLNKSGKPDSSKLSGAFSEAIKLGQNLLTQQLKNSK